MTRELLYMRKRMKETDLALVVRRRGDDSDQGPVNGLTSLFCVGRCGHASHRCHQLSQTSSDRGTRLMQQVSGNGVRLSEIPEVRTGGSGDRRRHVRAFVP